MPPAKTPRLLPLVAALGLLLGCGARAQPRPEAPAPESVPGEASVHPRTDATPDAPGSDAEPPTGPAVDEDAPPPAPGRITARPGAQVGVLLPLSGRAARLGTSLADGLAAARGPEAEPGPSLAVRDTGDEPGAAAEALLARPEVAGLVAVVDRAGAEAVVAATADVGKPVVLLTAADVAISKPGRVWRALHTPALVVRTAAGAGLARGGRTAIVLRPRTPAAEALANLFHTVWAAGGGQIAGEVDYDPAKPDWKALTARVAALPGDTLFLPDSALNAAQALATLASAGIWPRVDGARFGKSRVRELVVLGTPEWYSPEVARQSGRYLEGALIPVPFAAESVAGAKLAARFSAASRPVPTALDALLWEAVLGMEQAARRAAAEGTDVASALAGARSAEATVGLDFSAPDAVQGLFVLTVRDGRYTAAK